MKHRTPWVQTAIGRAVDLLDPKVEQISARDIAHALSRINRFNGYTIGEPWSVAQHSMLVESLLPEHAGPELRLAALLHDAHEAYLGDIATPVASAIVHRILARTTLACAAMVLSDLKDDFDRVIHVAFGLPEVLPAKWAEVIRWHDYRALAVEKDQLMAREPRSWGELPPAQCEFRLQPRPWLEVRTAFERRLATLTRHVDPDAAALR